MKRLAVLLMLCASPAFAQYLTPASGVQLRLESQFTGSCSTTNPPVGIARDSGKQFCCTAGSWVECSPAAADVSGVSGVSYTIRASGGTYYAKSGTTGADAYSGSDPAAVLQSAMNALGSAGGTIIFAPGTYVWQSVPTLPMNLTGRLEIKCQPGSIVQLTDTDNDGTLDAGEGNGFLKVVSDSTNDTLQHIAVDGCSVDNNNIKGTHAAILGALTSNTNWNIDDLELTNLHAYNLQTDADGTYNDHQGAVQLVISQATTPANQNTATHIRVDRVRVDGGNYGVMVNVGCARAGSAFVTRNTFFDDIDIGHVYFSTGDTTHGFWATSGVQVGSCASGDFVRVHDVECYNAGDNCIEVNAMEHITVENVTCHNTRQTCTMFGNWNPPPDAKRQVVNVRKVNEVNSLDLWSGFAVEFSKPTVADTGKTLEDYGTGTIVLDGVSITRDAPSGMSGQATVYLDKQYARDITYRNIDVRQINLAYSGGGTKTPYVMTIRPRAYTDDRTNVTLENMKFDITSSQASDGTHTTGYMLDVNGSNVLLNAKNVRFDSKTSGAYSDAANDQWAGLSIGGYLYDWDGDGTEDDKGTVNGTVSDLVFNSTQPGGFTRQFPLKLGGTDTINLTKLALVNNQNNGPWANDIVYTAPSVYNAVADVRTKAGQFGHVATVTGTITSGNLAKFDGAENLVDGGNLSGYAQLAGATFTGRVVVPVGAAGGSMTTLGLQANSYKGPFFQFRNDAQGDAWIGHNCYVANAGNYYFGDNGATFGCRGIRFGQMTGDGITFYADKQAATKDGAATPTPRAVIVNGGGLAVYNDAGTYATTIHSAASAARSVTLANAAGNIAPAGADTHTAGVFYSDATATTHDTGTLVCTALGLTCVTTYTPVGVNADCSNDYNTGSATAFFAVCR